MFPRSGNPFLTFLLSYHVQVTSKIQVNFRLRGLEVLMILSYGFSQFLHSRNLFLTFTELCSGDLENPSQLPVQEVLRGTDDFVLWIFTISSVFMFSMSRNPFLTFLLSYHVSGDLENLQVNFRFKRFLEVLMILSYGFSQFLQYLCFRGRGIHFWHSYWATMFRWPRKSRSTSGSRGSQRYWWFCLMDFHNFFSIYVFDVKESISDIPTEPPCFRWPQKSKSTSGSRGSQRYWWFCLMDFHNFFSIYVFEVKESISDIPTELSCLGDLENLGQLAVQ